MDVTKTASNPGFLKINSAKPETLSKSMRGSSSSSSSLPVELKSAANTQDHQIILFSNQFDPNIIEYCYQAKSKNFNCYAYNFSTKILYLTSSKVHISKIINLDGLNFLTLSENNLDINLPKTAISLLSRNLDNFPDLSVLLGSTSTSSASANFPNQNHRLSLTLNFNQFSTTFNEMNNNKEKSIYNFLKLKTKPTDIDKHIQARDTFPKFLDSYFVHVGKVHVFHFDSKTGTLVMAIICQKEFDNYQKSSTGSESQRTSSSSRSQNSNHQNSNFKFKEISYELSSYTEIQLICNLVNPFQDFPISVSLILPTNEILILYQNNKICKFSLNRIYRKMYSIWSQCTSLNDKNNSGISWINTSKNDKCWKRPEQLIPNSPSSDLCLDFQKIYSRVPLFQTAGPAEEQIFQKSLKLELPPGSSQTTALISSNRNDQVVIFGTNAGELFKYSLKKQKKIPGNWHLGRDFGSILNGQVSNEGNLLAFSPKGFLYIPLDDCSKFKTCQECSNSLTETSCGWCVLEGKCVAQKTCPFKNLLLGQGELIPITDQNKCPRILENGLSPISFSNQQNFIEFDITVFSIPGHYKYFCVLKSKNSHLQTSVEAEERGNTPETRNLACNFKNKRANLIQQILNPELTYERLEWSLVYRIMDPIRHTITHETVIDQLDVTVYNCQKFDTCTACVNKKSYLGNDFSFEYSCFWSSLDGKCSRTGNDFDNFSNLVSENDKCQYLKFNERSVEYNGQAVLLPAIPTSAASQTLNFEILNSASSNPVTYFMRIYKNSQALFNSQCQILKSHQISCQISRNLKILNSDNFSEDYTVKIYQQNEKPQTFFIEPEFVQTVYNCQSSQSCGECLYNSKLVSANCGWCQNLGVCSDRKFCREQTRKNLEVDSSSKALEIFGLNDASQPKNQVDLKTPQQAIFNNQICKFPKILNFSPSIGVIQGGNQLNISGIDLPFEASKFDISLGQKSTCHTSKITFDKNLKLFNISCLVASSHQLEANEKIKISATNYQISAVSNQFYKFVLPKITKILPEHGTKSGGQILTIFGNFLVLGGYLKTKIYLDIQNPQNQKRINCKILDFVPENLGVNDQIICQIENQPLINTEVKCKFRNSETDKTEIATLHLEIFDQQVTAKSHLSLYKDPCVSEISPNWSILEGGMNISVLGSGFRNGKNYFMINPLDLDENLSSETRQPCVIQDDSMIICYSPPASTFNPDSYFEREINFEFDGNRFLTGGLNLKYFPSPVIYFQEKEFVITSAFKSGSGPEVNANSESGGVPTGDFSNTETTSAIVILGSNICNFTPAGYHTNDCNAAMQYLKIKINDQVAKIKALTDDTITVYPPSNLKSGVYDINVELGSTFKKLAGKLNYKTSVVNLLTSEVLYGSLGVLVLISIFIIILICHQQKKVENVENEQKLFVKKMMTDQSKKLQAEKNDMFYLLCQDQSDNENDDFYDNSLAEVHCFKDYLLKVLFNGNHYGKYCQLLTGSSKTGTLCGNTLGAVSRDSNYNINYYNTLGKVGYAGQTLPRSLQNNNNPDTCQTNSNTLKSLRKDLYHTNSDYLNDENFSQVISHNYQLKLRTLDELKENLKNKEFLAAIVSVLDDNLSANEKSNVSGLLCVIFLDNFDYLTEVLMSNLRGGLDI